MSNIKLITCQHFRAPLFEGSRILYHALTSKKSGSRFRPRSYAYTSNFYLHTQEMIYHLLNGRRKNANKLISKLTV